MTEQEKKMWADDVAMIGMLREEKEELQARIDKAIEYIEEWESENDAMNYVPYVKHTLDKILKGE